MTVVDALQELVEVLLGRVLSQATRGRLQLVQQRVVQILEHEVEAPLAPEHLDHVHQVVVTEFLEGFKLLAAYSYTICFTDKVFHCDQFVDPGF